MLEGKQDPPIFRISSGDQLNQAPPESACPPFGIKNIARGFNYNIPEKVPYFPTNQYLESQYKTDYLSNISSKSLESKEHAPGNQGPAQVLKGYSDSNKSKNCGKDIPLSWVQLHALTPLDYLNMDQKIFNQEKERETYFNKTVVKKMQISQQDLIRLDSEGEYEGKLSGEIVNAFLHEIVAGKDIGMPSTYFGVKISKAQETGYKGLLRQQTIDQWLNETSKLFIPLHQPEHWTLCVVERANNTIYHYNSLIKCTSEQNELLKGIASYLEYIGYTSNTNIIQLKNIPQQNNGYDCGVFTCAYAYYAVMNKEIDFGQEQMQYFRLKIIKELMKSKIPRIYNKSTFTWAHADGGEESYITYDNISKEQIQDNIFESIDNDPLEPEEYKNIQQYDVNSICKYLDNMSVEDKKQRLIMNYREQNKDELHQLRQQTKTPYLDYNEHGNLVTINMENDLSRNLRLNEILKCLKIQHNLNLDQAWKLLETNLINSPQILHNWLSNKAIKGEKEGPTYFQVGSTRNMKKLLNIYKKIKNKDRKFALQFDHRRKKKRLNPYKRRRENKIKQTN